MSAKQKIQEAKIVAIARGIPADKIVELGRALLAGGMCCVEVTFDHKSEGGVENTLKAIEALSRELGDQLAVGAGTVLTARQVADAHKAGATYIISPDANPEVIRVTKQYGMCSSPGAMTPAEVVQAYDAGADFVKLFPITSLGVSYIKALRGPLSHIPLLAVGGVNPDNLDSFLAAGACGVGVGGNLVSLKVLEEQGPEAITALARQYTDALAKIGG